LKLDRDALEEDVPSLLARADRTYLDTRALRPTAQAAAGLEKADRLSPDDPDVLWRSARVYLTLAYILDDPPLQRKFARKAYQYASRTVQLAPSRPEGYYFQSASAGIRASMTRSPNLDIQKQVAEPALKLQQINDKYARGGAMRILGAMYASAPAWPVGVGDLDEAIEILEEAIKRFPSEPLNHFFLGEAYLKVGRTRDGIRELHAVLAAPQEGVWGLECTPYRTRALRLIRDHSESP